MVARQPGGRARVVISRDPYPIAPELQAAQGGATIDAQSRCPSSSWKPSPNETTRRGAKRDMVSASAASVTAVS